jgi:hypothetical protein
VCIGHGGFFALHKQGRIRPANRVNRRLRQLEAAGRLPTLLVSHPAWIAVRAKGARAALVAREMVEAFEAGDAAWIAALRKVRQTGLIP